MLRRHVLVLVIGLALVCAALYAISKIFGHGAGPLELTFMSVSNTASGQQVALFSLSNRTASDIAYLADRTLRPCYALSHWEVSPGVMRGTNYNLGDFTNARPATLAAHTSLLFPVYIPSGISDAVLEVSYEGRRRGVELLKEKARGVVENYGGKFPLSVTGVWTNIQIQQPFERRGRVQ